MSISTKSNDCFTIHFPKNPVTIFVSAGITPCLLSMVVMMSFGMIGEPVFAEVSKEELFANPSLISAKLSPDGKTMAYVGADEMGISNVFISKPGGFTAGREQISFFTNPEIIQFFWSGDSKKVLLLKDENGTGRLNLHGIPIDSKEPTVYTEKFPNINAKVLQISSKKNSAVVGLNHRNPHFHDLYLLDLDSGHFELLLENNSYAKFLLSDDLNLILKMRIHDEDGSWTVLNSDDEVFLELTSSEAFQTEFLSYNEKNHSVYLLDNRFSDTNQLVVKPLSIPGAEKVLGAPADSDIDDVLFIGGEPVAYASYYEQKKWHVIDTSLQEDFTYLEDRLGAHFEVLNTNSDGDLWVILNSIPDQGEQFWIYDKKNQKLSSLPTSQSQSDSFSKMYSMTIHSRDGQKLVCYYTLPKELDKGGYVDKSVPLVVVPHGGPFKVRDKFRFNPFDNYHSRFSLGEGSTPLLESKKLGEYVGLDSLLLKNETLNPTWSFKDRGSLPCILMAKERGEHFVATIKREEEV